MEPLDELRDLVAVAENRRTPTCIPRVAMVRGKVPEHALTAVYEPMINLVVQGKKTLTIGDQTLHYGPATYFVMSVDLPAVGTIHQAGPARPYLAVSLSLLPEIIAEVLEHAPHRSTERAGFAVARLTPQLLDAWLRLLRLTRAPEEAKVLGPLYEKEILFRVLQGPEGQLLRDIALPDSAVSKVRGIIEWMRKHYARPLPMSSLARRARMSESAFHRHFRAVTALSPLQFQKQLRLVQARALLLENGHSAANVAFEVGYESASQFNREYARFFGRPPATDARSLRARLAGA